VRRVVELFEVQDDEPEQIRPPAVRKQSDETNLAWAARFRRERDLPPAALIDGSP
jgi:LPS sulfotransferase NodH